MNKGTLLIRARKHTGTITSLASFFSRRNISIERMSCSCAGDPDEMTCSVTYACNGGSPNIIAHLVNMHDVIDVCHLE